MKKLSALILFVGASLLYSCSKDNDVSNSGGSSSESKPIAHFTINNLSSPGVVMERKTLDITNDSENAVSYTWEFEKGCISTAKVPDYSFLTCGGPFTIKLTAISKSGESSTYTESVTVLCKTGGAGNNDGVTGHP